MPTPASTPKKVFSDISGGISSSVTVGVRRAGWGYGIKKDKKKKEGKKKKNHSNRQCNHSKKKKKKSKNSHTKKINIRI
jgi:hypothetical protein